MEDCWKVDVRRQREVETTEAHGLLRNVSSKNWRETVGCLVIVIPVPVPAPPAINNTTTIIPAAPDFSHAARK
jgi:hypothetical protein